jgi:hypothetical protein
MSLTLWAYIKIVLALTIPIGTFAYARQYRINADCRTIQSMVSRRGDVDWELSHRQEYVQRSQAESQTIRRLLQDLDS